MEHNNSNLIKPLFITNQYFYLYTNIKNELLKIECNYY